MLVAVLEKATGMPLADYARQQLVGPPGFAEPGYRGSIVQALRWIRNHVFAAARRRVQSEGKQSMPRPHC